MGNIFDEARAALHAVWMRRWIALAVAWAICLIGWLFVSQMPNRYESHARVFVQLSQILPADGAATADQQKNIDRVRQTLTSAVSLEKVVRGTDLARTVATDRDVADRIASLQQMIKLTEQADNLFEITVTAGSGKLARQIAQKVIDIFVEDNLSDTREQSSASLQFLDQQINDRQKALQDADAKKSDFQARYLGGLPGTGTLSERVDAARQQLAQVETDLSAQQSALNTISAQMAGTPATVAGMGGTSAVGPARARLAAIQGQLAEARSRGWTDAHPDVIALKSQLAQASAAARSEPVSAGGGGVSNPLYMTLQASRADKQAQVAALAQRRGAIEADLQKLQSAMNDNPEAAAEMATIDRDYQVLKDQYDKLLADREQVRIRSSAQSQSDGGKFQVIDPPTQPRGPTAPNRPLLLTGVLFAGLAGGVAGAFLLGKLQTTFPTAGKLEKASGMPVIGSIGQVLTKAQIGTRRKQLTLFAGGVSALCVAWIGLLGVEMLQRGLGA